MINFKIITLFLACFSLIACSTTPRPVNYAMDCDQLMIEIQNARSAVKSSGTNSEATRNANTTATVASQGASIAGVPYVGQVIGLGRTLLSHNKQTATIKKQQAQDRLDELMALANRQNCREQYLY